MKRLFLFLALLLWARYARAATPALVQHVTGPTETSAISSYKLQFANASLASNLIVVSVATNNAPATVVTVADNLGNTYAAGPTVSGNQIVSEFHSLGSTAGVLTITISFSVAVGFVQAVATEFNNIATSAATDGSSTGTGTSTAVATGAIVTGTAGDLIYHVGWSDAGTRVTAWTQGASPWKLLEADISSSQIGGAVAQWQVQAAAGSITPSATQNASLHFDTVAIAFKNAAAGTAPAAGIRVVAVHHSTIQGVATSPIALQIPTTGNLIIVTVLTITGFDVTAVSDGNSNTYSFAGATFVGAGGGDLRIAYVCGATTSTTMTGPTLTLTGSNSNGDTVVTYDVTGAATSSCFDSTAGNPTATGTDATTGTHAISTVAINPSTTNGLIVSMMGITNPGPTSAVSPGRFIACLSSPEATNGEMDENNGWGIEYNAATGSRTYSYTVPAAAGVWAAMAAAFQAPAAGGAVHQLTTLGVGN